MSFIKVFVHYVWSTKNSVNVHEKEPLLFAKSIPAKIKKIIHF